MNIQQRFLILGISFCLFPALSFGQTLQLADSLFQMGKKYDNRGNMEESEFYYREAYNLYQNFEDTASWLEAGKEYASAMVYRAKNEQAMELYKKLLNVNHPANDAYNRGDLYNSMGWSSRRTGEIDQARKYYQKSLPLAEESGDSLLIGVVYSNLGRTHRAKDNFLEAMEQEQKALSYFKALNMRRNISNTLYNIGGIYRELALYDKALEYYNRSFEIREELEDVYLLADTYSSIGIVQRQLGNYDQALISYQKSLELSRKAGAPKQTSIIFNNIGLLYKILGEYNKALEYYRQSLAIKEETSGPGSIATTSKNIGKLLWDQQKFEEAEPYYQRALEIRRQVGNARDIASSLNTMVDLALEEKNYEQAQRYTNEIQLIGDSTESYRIRQYAARYMGKINAQQGQYGKSIKHYKKASAYSDYLSPNKKLNSLTNLARQYDKMNADSAVFYGEKAIDMIEKRRVNAGATAELKSGYFGRYSDFYAELASWTLKYHSDMSRAYKLIEKAKARSLSDGLAKASKNIDQQLPEEVRLERSEKRNRIDELYSELESTVDEEKRAAVEQKIRSAELDYAAYENNLQSQYPELKSLQLPEPISLDRAQALTDEQTAVLEYAVAGDELIIFLISQQNVHAKQFTLSENKPLDELLTSWVGNFKSAILSNASQSKLRSQSAKLYNNLLKPFEDELEQFTNLLIVPDGALAYLPFEAISQGDQYLIKNFHIKYVPSLTSLTLLHNSEETSRQDLLAVAGSQLSEDNISGNSLRKSNLSALPSTLIEVDSIATQFQETAVLKDEEVSEQNLKKMLQDNQYRYIHLATHGIIDENHPGRSGLALSTDQKITASSQEDGMLRSSEIFGMDIKSEMVVLSACNTGLGKIVKGEGILGMQRSFFFAGASTVVVSLWNVYDRSTASFMNEFYKALLNSEPEESWTDSMLRWVGWDKSIPFGQKASAMHKAKLQMIKHPLFNHPVYWAPFVVVGR